MSVSDRVSGLQFFLVSWLYWFYYSGNKNSYCTHHFINLQTSWWWVAKWSPNYLRAWPFCFRTLWISRASQHHALQATWWIFLMDSTGKMNSKVNNFCILALISSYKRSENSNVLYMNIKIAFAPCRYSITYATRCIIVILN